LSFSFFFFFFFFSVLGYTILETIAILSGAQHKWNSNKN